MTPERQRQIMGLLEAAQELAAGERHAFLEQACAGDEALQREVESLLAADGKASGFLAGAALQDAAKLLAEQATLPMDAPDNPAAATTPEIPLAPGVLLGERYLIERELGHGGIGVVFLARDQRLENRPVVVKALLETRLKGEQRAWFEKKFRDEVKALARIEDSSVVRPLDVGQLADGRSYLVMEYVEGQPLRQLLPPSGLALPRAARLLRQIARALAAAHARGVIHRDLTPNNILLQNPEATGELEQIKLIDFGLATVRDALAASRPLTTMVAGTPPFMAPEQMRGKPEKASDIYALGVLAYQMVTGQLPFAGNSVSEIHAAQQAGIKTSPCELRPDLPQAAQAAILRALALKPEDRYDSPTAFSADFQRALTELPSDPLKTNVGHLVEEEKPVQLEPAPDALPTQQLPARRRLLIPAAALLAVVVLGVLVWLASQPEKPPNAEKSAPVTLPVAVERNLIYSLTVQKNPRLYPGRQPFVTFGGESVEEGDGLRFTLSSPQDGYLYLINEWPSPANDPSGLTVLFPSPNDNRGSAQVNANQVVQLPPDKWLRFVEEKGTEKYWLIWAEQRVPELEALRPDAAGDIQNRSQITAVQQFLAAHPRTAFKAEPDEARQQIKLSGAGKVLVGLATLEHR